MQNICVVSLQLLYCFMFWTLMQHANGQEKTAECEQWQKFCDFFRSATGLVYASIHCITVQYFSTVAAPN